jgi:hypothetical protein
MTKLCALLGDKALMTGQTDLGVLLSKARISRDARVARYIRYLARETPGLTKIIHRFLQARAQEVSADIIARLFPSKFILFRLVYKVSRADVKAALDELDLQEWTVLIGELTPVLDKTFKDAGARAIIDLGIKDTEDIVSQLDENALRYARERAAELVGKRVTTSGKIINNPRADMVITEGTRDYLRELVAGAVEEGMSTGELADAIEGSYAFSESRAETIARTELASAHVQGNLTTWRDSGVVEYKESVLGSEHDVDDECDENADAGPIPLEDSFPSGDDGPPYHPNCVCAVVPVVREAEE